MHLYCVLLGWGKLEFGGRSPSVLQEVPVPIWQQDRCVPNFAQTIFNTTLCAGAFEGGKDACQVREYSMEPGVRKQNALRVINAV